LSIELVDNKLCNGCGICVDTCPLDVIRLDTFVSEEGYPPCRVACPAGVDIRSYIYFVRNGMMEEAVDLLREQLPFPAITGRVCPHPCEAECSRNEIDEAVNINAVERFTADYWLTERAYQVKKIYSDKIAIIGSGPAGLSCAYFLCRMGYSVTVFESLPVLGGMLRIGIPEFRLPRDILDSQINYIRDMGVEFQTGVNIGKDITLEELKEKYQAIFIAVGNQLSSVLDIEGSNLEGVLWGLDFLRDVNMQKKVALKGSVVVVGGGNVAIDVALTALRSGAKEVQIACLEDDNVMPAFKEEIQQAKEEGVIINTSWGPRKIKGNNGRVSEVEFIRCLSVFDASGSFHPSFDEKVTKSIKADAVILAIGQSPDLSLLPEDIELTDANNIKVDPITLQTSKRGIFAGGDIVSGKSVVEAISTGKRAAESIDRFHKGIDMKAGRYAKPTKIFRQPREGMPKLVRQQASLIPISQRKANFGEVKLGLNEDQVYLESQRCMTCGSRAIIRYVDDCMLCLFCERDCPQKAIYVSPEKRVLPFTPYG
jgi:NADPH-dependent glutamate synthase beta subunit-like oxidoreductase/NAD-dependent dihydropyrimidine dehydrogenase PreA subunit